MRIDWALTCRYAESDGTLATIVAAGVDVVTVTALPAPVAVMVAVRLAAPADEFDHGATHDVTCRVLDPDGAPVLAQDGTPAQELQMTFAAPEDGVQQRVTGWLVNPLFAFQVGWLANVVGSYTIETSAGADTHRSPIHVLLDDAADPAG